MRPRALLAAAGAIALLARSPLAKAEVREAVERVAEAWRARGASVAVDRSRFLNDDGDEPRPVVVALPDLPDGPCTTVLLLGARGLGFHVRAP